MRWSVALVFIACNHAPPRVPVVRLPAPVATAAPVVDDALHAVAQMGPRGEIWALAWSPRGDRIATGSFDHTIRVWSDDGMMLAILRGHREALTDLAWSPRGDVLASAARDGTVRLWDLRHAGKHIKLDHAGDHVAFDEAGDHVVSVGYDMQARVWSVATGALERTLVVTRGRQLRAVAWSPDGKRIAASSLDGELFTWNAETWALANETGGRFGRVRFSPDGATLIGASGHALVAFDVATMTSRTLSHTDVEPSDLCFSPDGKTIVTNGSFGALHTWDLASGRHTKTIAHPGYIEAVACAPKDARFVAGGKEPVGNHVELPRARVYDSVSGRERSRLEGSTQPVAFAAWDARGDTLITSGAEVAIWDAHTGGLSHVVSAERENVEWNPERSLVATLHARSVRILDGQGNIAGVVPITADESTTTWSRDGATLAIWSREGGVVLWDATKHTTRRVKLVPSPRSFIWGVAFRPSSKEIGVATHDRVDTYAIDTGQPVKTYAPGTRAASYANIDGFAFGPHEELVATLNGGHTLLFDAHGTVTGELGDRSWFAMPTFSHDGLTIAYAAKHDIALSGALGGHLVGHDDVIRSIEWSPNRRELASSSDDQSVRVWKPGKPQPVHDFETYDGRVWSVAWHPRGKALVGVGNESMIHRLADNRTLIVVAPGAISAAWFTEDGAFAGDEKALAHVVLRQGDDLVETKIAATTRWRRTPELLSDL
jgi:WD40 repeat protein